MCISNCCNNQVSCVSSQFMMTPSPMCGGCFGLSGGSYSSDYMAGMPRDLYNKAFGPITVPTAEEARSQAMAKAKAFGLPDDLVQKMYTPVKLPLSLTPLSVGLSSNLGCIGGIAGGIAGTVLGAMLPFPGGSMIGGAIGSMLGNFGGKIIGKLLGSGLSALGLGGKWC